MADEERIPEQEDRDPAAKVRATVADIMTNPNNPMYARYKKGDEDVHRHIDSLYKALPGGRNPVKHMRGQR